MKSQHTMRKEMENYKFDLSKESLIYINDVESILSFELFLSQCQLVGIDTEHSNSPLVPTLLQLAMRSHTGEEKVFLFDLLALKTDALAMEKLNTGLSVLLSNPACIKLGQALQEDFMMLSKHFRKQLPCLSERIDTIVDVGQLFSLLYPFELKSSLQFMVARKLRKHLPKSQQRSSWDRRPLRSAQIEYAACDALVLFRLFDTLSKDFEEQFPDKNIRTDFAISIPSYGKIESPTKLIPLILGGKSLSLVREELGIDNELLIRIIKELSPITSKKPYTTIASIHSQYFPQYDLADIKRLFCDDLRVIVIDDYLFRTPLPSLLGKRLLFCREVLYHLLTVRQQKMTIEECAKYFEEYYPTTEISKALPYLPPDSKIFYQIDRVINRNQNGNQSIAFAIDIHHFIPKDLLEVENELQEILNYDLQYVSQTADEEATMQPLSIETIQLLDSIHEYLLNQSNPQQGISLSILQTHFNNHLDRKEFYHLLCTDEKNRFVLIKDQVFPTLERIDIPTTTSNMTPTYNKLSKYLSTTYYLLQQSGLPLSNTQLLSYLEQRFPYQNQNTFSQVLALVVKDPRFRLIKLPENNAFLFEVKEQTIEASSLLPTTPCTHEGSEVTAVKKEIENRTIQALVSASLSSGSLSKELQDILDYHLQFTSSMESTVPVTDSSMESTTAEQPKLLAEEVITLLNAIHQLLHHLPRPQEGISLSSLHSRYTTDYSLDQKELYSLLGNDSRHRFTIIKDQVFPTIERLQSYLPSTIFNKSSYYLSMIYYLLQMNEQPLTNMEILQYLEQRFPQQNSQIFSRVLVMIRKDPRFVIKMLSDSNDIYQLDIKNRQVHPNSLFPSRRRRKMTSSKRLDQVKEKQDGEGVSSENITSPWNDKEHDDIVKQLSTERLRKTATAKPLRRLRAPREDNRLYGKQERRRRRTETYTDSASFLEPRRAPAISALLDEIAKYLHEDLSDEEKLQGVEIKDLYSRFISMTNQSSPSLIIPNSLQKLTDFYWYLDHDPQRRFIILQTKVYPLLRDLEKCWIPVSPRVMEMNTFHGQRHYLQLCKERYLEDQMILEKIYYWLRLQPEGIVSLDEVYQFMARHHGGIFRYIRQSHQGQSFSAFIKFTLRMDPRMEVVYTGGYPKTKSMIRLKDYTSSKELSKASMITTTTTTTTAKITPPTITTSKLSSSSTSIRESLQKIIQTSSGLLKKWIK